jgi:GNAT superfamily N-acetyltransferase
VSPASTAQPTTRTVGSSQRATQTHPLDLNGLPSATDLLDAALGAGFIDPISLLTYAIETGCEDRFGLLSSDPGTGQHQGVALIDAPVDADSFRSLMPDGHAADRILRMLPGLRPDLGSVGVIRTIAVATGARRSGVGSVLVREATDRLRAMGVERVVSLGWARTSSCPIQTPLLGAGFTAAGVLPHLWLEDSLARGYTCPACPNGHCRCAAVVFTASTWQAARLAA